MVRLRAARHFAAAAFSEEARRRSLSASLVFAVLAILSSVGAIGWGLYAFFESLELLRIVGGPVAGAIPYVMFAGGVVNLVVGARSARVAVVARAIGSGRIAKSIFRIAFNVAALVLPALIIDTVCGAVVLFSAALADLISRSSLFAASFNYYSNSVAQSDLDTVQTNLLCCGAQSPSDWAAPINRSPPAPQSATSVPRSCCPPQTHAAVDECLYLAAMAPGSVSGAVAHAYHDGCIPQAISFLYTQHFVSSGIAFAMALFMLLVAVCQRLAQTSARAALESGDSGGPAPAWLFRDPRRHGHGDRDRGPAYSLWTDEPSPPPRPKPAVKPKRAEAPRSAEEPPPKPPPPPPLPPPPTRSQVRQIKHIRLPESSGTSAREEVYEVSSPGGPPAYYGADGLLLNQSKVEALHSSANELPQVSENVPPAEKTQQPPKKKKMKFSLAKVVRKAVSRTKTAGSATESDVELKEGFRKGRKEPGVLLRLARSEQQSNSDETRLLTPDKESNSPRRSRQAARQPGIHRQRKTEADRENGISLRLQDETSTDSKSPCLCDPSFAPASTYYTSSDMPTEMSATPVPTSEENYVMGLRRSPTPSTTSRSSWSSKESSPHRRPLPRDKASQTSFVEDEDTVVENSISNKTLVQETNPFYGALAEEKGAVYQQLTKACSLSYVVADERMPVEGPRRCQSQRLSTIESVPSTSSWMLTDQKCRSSGCVVAESLETSSHSEPKRRRTECACHEKIDCGVPNESSEDAGLLSDDAEGSWKELSEGCSIGFGAPLPPVPPGETTEVKEAVSEGTTYRRFTGSTSGDRNLKTIQETFLLNEEPELAKQGEGFQPEDPPCDAPTKAAGDDAANAAGPHENVSSLFRRDFLLNTEKVVTCESGVENNPFCQRMGSHCPDVRDPCPASEVPVADAGTTKPADGRRREVECNFVCGIPDDVSSWFAIDSKPRGRSEKLELGGSITGGLIESSKHLGIAVPHEESIQLLFKAKPRESSHHMLDDRYVLCENRTHWTLEEASNLNEENAPTFSCEVKISPPKNVESTKSAFAEVDSESRICNECERRFRVDGCATEKDKTEVTQPTANILGKQSFLFKISSAHSVSKDSVRETEPKNLSKASASEDCNLDSSVIIVTCSRNESAVDQTDRDKDGVEGQEVLQKSGILIELDNSINAFSVASGVASVGFLCLKDYTQMTNTRRKITPKNSRQDQTTPQTPMKQGTSYTGYPTRKKSPLPKWKSAKTISLQRCASTSKHTKTRLKCEKSKASATSLQAPPMVPPSSPADVLVCQSEPTEKPTVPEDRSGVNSGGVDASVSRENKQQTTFMESTAAATDPDQVVTEEAEGWRGIPECEQQRSERLPEDQQSHDRRSDSQVVSAHQTDTDGTHHTDGTTDSLGKSDELQEGAKEKITTSPDVLGSEQWMCPDRTPQTAEIQKEQLQQEKGDFVETLDETGAGTSNSAIISEHQECALFVPDHDDNQEMNRDRESRETYGDRAVEPLAMAQNLRRPETAESQDASFKQQTVRTERIPTYQEGTDNTGSRELAKVGNKKVSSTESAGPKKLANEPSGDKAFQTMDEPRVSRNEIARQLSSTEHILTVHRDGERTSEVQQASEKDKNAESKMDALVSSSEPAIPWADLPPVLVKNPNEKQPISGNGGAEPGLAGNLPPIRGVCKRTSSNPCLAFADWTSTETSQGSTEFPIPSEMSLMETGNPTTKNSNASILNQNTSASRIPPPDKRSCPAAEGPVSAVSNSDQGKFKSPSSTCQEMRTNLPDEHGSPSSLCFHDQEYYQSTGGSGSVPYAGVKDGENAASAEEDSKVANRVKLDPRKDLNYDQKLEPRGECLVLHDAVQEPTSQSDQSEVKICDRNLSGGELYSKRRVTETEHSGTSIQTQSLPSTFNLTGTSKLDKQDSGGYRQTPRTLHKYRVENLLHPLDSSAEGRPPSAGDYASEREFTPTQRYFPGGGSVMGGSLIAVPRVFLSRRRIGKMHILENPGRTVPDSEPELPPEITDSFGPLIDILSAARDLDSPGRNSPSLTMFDDTVTKLEGGKLNSQSQCPGQPSKTSARWGTNIQSPKEISFQNPILDRRKVPVGNCGDATAQQPNEKCGNCGEMMGSSSAYRIGQHSNMADMGISASQLTTNVYHRDGQTCCELSSKSSSSYNCRACDCSVNKQTSIEDSSPCTGTKSPDKRKKRRKQSEQESQPSFASASSASTDFLHTSDFESAEGTSNITGRIRRRLKTESRTSSDYDADSEESGCTT